MDNGLVLLEYKDIKSITIVVLILIVVDNGLVRDLLVSDIATFNVLILIVVDNGLVPTL